ncbi:MarR family winged helix-turn-helix transcriptional regulator [Furfurilactobacillus curtus]|uniref:HTH marR-type domain-containing protein n=1 Tax=Furfurilactobacillus curtus TaxID=1746200 RepID=A0ABQ5JS06_9LACO
MSEKESQSELLTAINATYMKVYRPLDQLVHTFPQMADHSFPVAMLMYEISQHKQITVTSLASANQVSLSSVSSQITGLIKEGLIESVPQKVDRRVREIQLTAKGQAIEEQLEAYLASAFQAVELAQNKLDFKQMIKILTSLADQEESLA